MYVSEYGTYNYTVFYEGEETKTRNKYGFFGPLIVYTEPKKVFEIGIDVTDPSYTKDDVRIRVLRQIELLNRQEEIDRGEII